MLLSSNCLKYGNLENFYKNLDFKSAQKTITCKKLPLNINDSSHNDRKAK